MKTNRLGLILVFLAVGLLSSKSFGGIKWVDVGVNGLTCSMCTRSVEMSVIKLDFVDSVSMSLEKTEGRIYLKEGSPIDLKKIAQAVVDAGFSVRFLKMEFDFKDVQVAQDGSFTFQGQTYQWLEFKDGLAKGEVALKLVDEGFLTRKECSYFKKKFAISSGGQKVLHVVLET